MGTNEVVSASRVWEYFQSNKGSIKDHMYLIAENKDFGVEVYISNDGGLPEIIVTADDVEVLCETVLNEIDCKKTVQSVYDIYLTERAVLAFMDDEDFDDEMVEDYIENNEARLNMAVKDFIFSVTNERDSTGFDSYEDEVIEDIKDHFCEYLYRKHGINVYRPMILEYDDGTDEYTEYPYDDMEFSDMNNPIYKNKG